MDYEKKYKEAVKAIESLLFDAQIRHSKSVSANALADVFHELAESDDERVRKALISFLKSPFVSENITDEKVTPWITWLEKQGEQKPVNTDYISRIRKELLRIEDNAKNINGLTESQWVAIRATHRLLGEYITKEQKPAEWSEEDKMQLDAAIHLVSSTGHIETANWLKSLKDRVLQQNITVTDEELAKAKKDAYNDALDKIEYHSVEYIRADAFIEKAAEWQRKELCNYFDAPIEDFERFIEDFKNYMKGE